MRPVLVPAALMAMWVLVPTASSQALRVRTDSARVTVGDSVTAEVHAALPAGAELVEPLPVVLGPLPDGVRLLSADTLRRSGTDWVGRVQLVYFRAGAAHVPALVVRYRRASGAAPDSLVSTALPFVVASVLPPVNNTMRDIKDVEYSALPLRTMVLLFVLAIGLAGAAWAFYRRRRARLLAAAAARLTVTSTPPPPTAYERAVQRLADVAAAGLVARGEVDQHYALIAEVLRGYLEEAHDVPALERTTGELLWSLPPQLAVPALREACRNVLEESDLVKFARLRPTATQAAAYAGRARTLLDRWHGATATPVEAEMLDAVR